MPPNPTKSILVVEDDVDIREGIVGILRDEGYAVDGAGNGLEALDFLRAPQRVLPAIILLDLMMPVMNGWQFRAEQQQDAGLSAIPFVVISADSSVKQKSDAIGAAAFLKKPIELKDLLAVVARYCE